MISEGNTSKALSDINKPLNTCSCSRETQSSKDMPPFEVAKNIWEQISKSPKCGIVIKENPVIDEHNSSSKRSNEKVPHPNIKRDFEIASLKNHIESRDTVESSHTHVVKNVDKGKAIMQESQPQNSISIASLFVHQLQEKYTQ
ncbi:ty3-gypsy retrotransposon protein [Cucumis melo var. makuwa]|uniref:Ty3-gypsy retrotransposon protein n=1 Tax=Cucumis melo var. makuwa TaxID=1194695 RepID=A0A5D3D802_CUCMM|nr:ty3-gypsy retrotransposon protein [Cucumis melo var. makuwa]TYK19688.1 ty3-gypsy retrotransposon protein [Cucumis melo var. makuwa]